MRAWTTGVRHAQAVLCGHIALSGGHAIPLDGFLVILCDAFASLVRHSQVVLRRRKSLFRSQSIPQDRFFRVLRNALAGGVLNAQVGLRVRMSLLCGHELVWLRDKKAVLLRQVHAHRTAIERIVYGHEVNRPVPIHILYEQHGEIPMNERGIQSEGPVSL